MAEPPALDRHGQPRCEPARRLRVERLSLTVLDPVGQEHRVRPLARLVAEALAERLSRPGTVAQLHGTDVRLDRLVVPPVTVDLRRTADVDVAGRLADAILDQVISRRR